MPRCGGKGLSYIYTRIAQPCPHDYKKTVCQEY